MFWPTSLQLLVESSIYNLKLYDSLRFQNMLKPAFYRSFHTPERKEYIESERERVCVSTGSKSSPDFSQISRFS